MTEHIGKTVCIGHLVMEMKFQYVLPFMVIGCNVYAPAAYIASHAYALIKDNLLAYTNEVFLYQLHLVDPPRKALWKVGLPPHHACAIKGLPIFFFFLFSFFI